MRQESHSTARIGMSGRAVVGRETARCLLLGCPVDALTLEETSMTILERIERGVHSSQFSLNAAKVVEARRSPRLLECLERATIVNADGQSLVWAGRILGVRVPERVAGIDLLARLLEVLEREGKSAYFLGARQEVIERAVARIADLHPSLRIAGFHHGHFPPEDDERVASSIESTDVDALFVGMSSPRKEHWIDSYQQLTGATFAMGVGGSFDVVAGLAKRAPVMLQRLGLEWAYRTAQEPRRLAGRYARTNLFFAGLVAQEAIRKHLRRRERTP